MAADLPVGLETTFVLWADVPDAAVAPLGRARWRRFPRWVAVAVLALLGAEGAKAWQQEAAPADAGEPLRIVRVDSPIEIDGELTEPAWQQAVRVTTWFETRPGDNVEPKVGSVAYLVYDDEFFYAGFELGDPDPEAIKAPLGDRDHVPSYTDYAGVIVNPSNDGKTAQMFLANPRGIQYDAISSDAAGEDSAPDFYWDSAARITPEGWVLEMRIPFSSLRYEKSDPDQWRILLYRNWPREFRYQMFSSRLPRDMGCFICNSQPLVGLAGLPSGSHWVVAPYAFANQVALPEAGPGSSLASEDPDAEVGLDAKWIPNPNTVIDATLNPDFSQIESDVAQISANERFALFFPERRPFFLEGIDLFSTPLQAVYTRSFNQPRWGLRSTGRLGPNTYTLLVGEDEGGGAVILPGVLGSSFAPQDFESLVAIGRWRRDFGESFASVLYSGREIDGGGFNRVFGPDFRWRPTDHDTISGQLLLSRSETPNRPDLTPAWDGRELSGWGGELWWNRRLRDWDFFTQVQAFDDEFRADNGFIPQVGFREGIGEVGRTFYPKDRPVSRLRLFTFSHYKEDEQGNQLELGVVPGFGLDALLSSFVRLELAYHELLAIEQVFTRWQLRPTIEMRPGRVLSYISVWGRVGEEVDFANDRLGDGVTVNAQIDVRPTDHLVLTFNGSRRWIDVTAENGDSGRLFTADVARLRATYTFDARSWLRLIGQWVHTERDPGLYTFAVDDESGGFGGSAVFGYKINWQTVLFVGYADNRALDLADDLQPLDRQFFLKLSYAFQG